MSLKAAVRHHAPGRIRLQLVDRDVKAEDFTAFVDLLSKSESLQRVKGNAINHSLLIEASDEEQLQAVLTSMTRKNILKVLPDFWEAEGLRVASWNKVQGDIDTFLNDISSGELDLRKMTAFLMLGLGAGQALRGDFLPAGLSLVFYGLDILDRPRTDVYGDR